MTDLPERISAGVAGEWEQALLESAALDAPTPEFKRTFSRRLGVALGSAGVLAVSGTSQAAAGVTWLKWLAIGFVVGTAGTGAGVQLTDWTQRNAPTVTRSARVPNRHGVVARTTPNPNTPPAASVTSSLEPMATLHAAKAVNAAPVAAFASSLPNSATSNRDSATSSGAVPAFRDEMAQLESIREALARGDTGWALRKLDAYDLAFPAGALAIESRILRLEALASAGESGAALQLARRFLSEHPDSPYAKRVASIALAQGGSNP